MEAINLRQQIVFFGNYDEIVPSVENIKYFIDTFGIKGLIPNQFKEINVNFNMGGGAPENVEHSRVRLTSMDGMWNIKFNLERVDFILTNANVGEVDMLPLDTFSDEVNEVLAKLNQKFPKKYKRLGIISQYLFTGFNANDTANKVTQTIDFFKDKPVLEWINKTATRTTIQIPNSEVINISNELRWVRTNLKINSKPSIVDGLLLTIDINTLNENQEYRFNVDNINTLLKAVSKISETIKLENLKSLN